MDSPFQIHWRNGYYAFIMLMTLISGQTLFSLKAVYGLPPENAKLFLMVNLTVQNTVTIHGRNSLSNGVQSYTKA